MGPMMHLSYLSKKSTKSKQSRKSRSKSTKSKKKLVKRKKGSTKSRSKSANKFDGYALSNCPPERTRTMQSSIDHPMSTMTPIHKILRNTFGSSNKEFYYDNKTPTTKKKK